MVVTSLMVLYALIVLGGLTLISFFFAWIGVSSHTGRDLGDAPGNMDPDLEPGFIAADLLFLRKARLPRSVAVWLFLFRLSFVLTALLAAGWAADAHWHLDDSIRSVLKPLGIDWSVT